MSTYRGSYHPANDDARRQWQNPEAILADIGLKPGLTFIDVGCGGGFFTLPAARMVGKTGLVYGLDANPRGIIELQKAADNEGLSNLKLTVAKGEDVVLCHACADIVFMGIVLHDFADPAKVLLNAREMVKPEGRLVNLDWKKRPTPVGPPLERRFDEERAQRLLKDAGFKIESVKEAGPYHYLILARH